MAPLAGQLLNNILLELAQDYDLSLTINTTQLTLTGSGPNNGTGPYLLPLNYLRSCSKDLTYYISGVPYLLVQITLAQFDLLILTQGVASYPTNYCTDISPLATGSAPYLYVYPPPVGSLTLQVRYYGSFPDITTPETSTQIPWFPNQTYLKTRLAGELMAITGDQRQEQYLGDGPQGSIGILRRFLNLQGDREDTGSQIILDPRNFYGGGAMFGPSKATGGV